MSKTQLLYSKRYYALLSSLVGLTFLAPLVDHSILSRVAVGVLLLASLVTATQAVRLSRRIDVKSLILAGAAALIWVMAFCVNTPPFNTLVFQLLSHAIVLIFFANISATILKDVLTGEVNANRICGSVCVFVLIGFCFSIIHMMISISDGQAYRDNTRNAYIAASSRHEAYSIFTYFSFCTLSTVGYGDMVPASRLARSTSCLEALSGQLYLTILIARLVGLHIAGSTTDTTETTETTESESTTSERKKLASSRR